ncbi:uncharacterized protein IL334_001994 [Kwoniella shivajii]|uniref:Uncharacterized protein n=1 Tax=Kwoniella shivajii TaxID=564305 RepID=A0ABZ1CXM9_9TREE|nr:hypothetical protein IL334_001994 [Kwoniella shivajii]
MAQSQFDYSKIVEERHSIASTYKTRNSIHLYHLITQSQLESTKIAFKELGHKTALLQDSLLAQIGSHIDVIIKAKEHAANSHRSIKALAETQ